ncbi:MAG: hypothetical protein IPO83_00860 [Chitinophagaceae bacterium]|nr:hypothetical protein [Chitinophagaceae bacterium]
MTKKEKKELALQLKAAIDAKKITMEKIVSNETRPVRNNHAGTGPRKSKERKVDPITGSKHKRPPKIDLDFDPW